MGIFATTTVHDVSHIRAYSTRSMGAPVTLEMTDKDTRSGTFIMFVGNQALADDLVAVINEACRRHEASPGDIVWGPEGAAGSGSGLPRWPGAAPSGCSSPLCIYACSTRSGAGVECNDAPETTPLRGALLQVTLTERSDHSRLYGLSSTV